MSVSDSKVTQNSVQNTVFEHIGAGASTSRSHHKDLDFDAFMKHQRSSSVRCDLIELGPMDASVSWNTSFPT